MPPLTEDRLMSLVQSLACWESKLFQQQNRKERNHVRPTSNEPTCNGRHVLVSSTHLLLCITRSHFRPLLVMSNALGYNMSSMCDPHANPADLTAYRTCVFVPTLAKVPMSKALYVGPRRKDLGLCVCLGMRCNPNTIAPFDLRIAGLHETACGERSLGDSRRLGEGFAVQGPLCEVSGYAGLDTVE